jgi:hypothetical protein
MSKKKKSENEVNWSWMLYNNISFQSLQTKKKLMKDSKALETVLEEKQLWWARDQN